MWLVQAVALSRRYEIFVIVSKLLIDKQDVLKKRNFEPTTYTLLMRYYCLVSLEELVYDYPLYRPPSEANSTILQVTLGCSFNHCSFCSMYRTKSYQERSLEEIKFEIDLISKYCNRYHLFRFSFIQEDTLLDVISTALIIQVFEEKSIEI